MAEIDPQAYGALTAKVDQLERAVEKLDANVERLLAMAERGKGAMWAGMTIASAVGAQASWLAQHWIQRP